jgi:LacI family transcriptional regulator
VVTISDVAKAAQVSKKTVSRVINNHPDVADTTRVHVQRVIERMGYRPSMLARGLAQGKTNIIGVIIDETAQDVFSYPLGSLFKAVR